MRRIALLFLAVALLYAGAGLLPGRTFAPLDLPLDSGAWKSDPTQRVRVSNSLLSDVITQFIPWDQEVSRSLARRDMPWIARFSGDGSPLFANPQTALFSPFTWTRLLFGLKGWAIAAILKLLAASLCAYWLARELDVERSEALVSAIVFATCGSTIVWLLWPHTNVFVLLPGLAAAGLRLMKTPELRNAALVILFAALCTAGGHPETLFVGVAGIWVFLTWEALRRPDFGLGALVPVWIGALLGFLLLFAQLVPFFLVLSESHAGAHRPELAHPFRVWAVAGQVLPGILGSPLRGELDLTVLAKGESFNHRNAGYTGALVLLALLLARRTLSQSLRRGLVIGGIGLVLSWYPPGVWAVARHVPVLRVLAFEYGAALFAMFGSIAAGPALTHLAIRQRKKIGTALVLAATVALGLGTFAALPAARSTVALAARAGIDELRARGHLQQPPEVYEQRLKDYLGAAGMTTLRRLALPGAFWLLAGIALLARTRHRRLLVTSAAIGELMAFGLGYNPAVRMSDVPPEPEIIRAVKQLDPQRQHLIAAHSEIFPANLGMLYGVRDAVSYDALTSKARVEQLVRAGYDPLPHTFNPILTADQTRAMAGLGVRYVLSRVDVANGRRIAGSPAPAAGVYELEGAVPVSLPPNRPPRGVTFGAIVTILAAIASAAWLRLYTLAPVTRLPPSVHAS